MPVKEESMDSSQTLELILKEYASTFDIYRNYEYCGITYPAYAKFYAHNEKYVLVKEAKLWEANCFEHVLFIIKDSLNANDIEDIKSLIREHMEPDMVRQKNRLPSKNHMYTYLTVVILCEGSIEKEAALKIKHFRYEKTYNLTLRGWSNARLACIDLNNKKFISNKEGRVLKKVFCNIF